MLRSVLVLTCLAAVTQASCGFPNGTDTKLNWWQGTSTANAKLFSVDVIDPSGNPEYPINLKQALNIKLHLDNEQGIFTAGKLLLGITIWEYGGFSGCSWSEVPTFGLLDNLDACETAVKCPVQKGDQILMANIDFTPFGSIISLLKDDAPYQIMIKLTDKNTNSYASIYAQARAKTK